MVCTDAATAGRPQERACCPQSLLKVTGGIDASVPDGSAYDGFSCALKARTSFLATVYTFTGSFICSVVGGTV